MKTKPEIPGPTLTPPAPTNAESPPANAKSETATAAATATNLASKIAHKPVSAIPAWVTTEELKTISEFEDKLSVFDLQIQRFTVPLLEKQLDAAVIDYTADPTNETFDAMRGAAIATGLVERNVIPANILAAVEAARAKFVSDTIFPFVRPILARGLSEARARLAIVQAEEEARHTELTGEPLKLSGILNAAQKPAAEFDSLLSAVNKETRHPQISPRLFQFLREHAVTAAG